MNDIEDEASPEVLAMIQKLDRILFRPQTKREMDLLDEVLKLKKRLIASEQVQAELRSAWNEHDQTAGRQLLKFKNVCTVQQAELSFIRESAKKELSKLKSELQANKQSYRLWDQIASREIFKLKTMIADLQKARGEK